MSLGSDDKREVCVIHGWVGRRAFLRDRHDLCEPSLPESAVGEPDDEQDEEETVSDPDAPDAPDVPDAKEARWSRAMARQRGIPSKKTLAVRRITQVELAAGRAELAILGADEPYDRPRTRGDCANVPRPCPYVACKYSLYLDVSETGSIVLNFPHLDPGEMPPDRSCALDLAERGAMTLEDIAIATNLTRERIRQVELRALIRRARPAAIAAGLTASDAAEVGLRHQVSSGADLEETGIEGAVPSDVATLLASSDGSDD